MLFESKKRMIGRNFWFFLVNRFLQWIRECKHLWYVYNLESTLYGIYRGCWFVLKQFVDGEVGRNDKFSVQKRNSSSFRLTCTGVLICPSFKVVVKTIVVKVVDENMFFASVTIEPFTLLLVERIWISLSCVVGFSNTGRTVYPYSSYITSLIRGFSIKTVDINWLFNLFILSHIDQALVDCFNTAHL